MCFLGCIAQFSNEGKGGMGATFLLEHLNIIWDLWWKLPFLAKNALKATHPFNSRFPFYSHFHFPYVTETWQE